MKDIWIKHKIAIIITIYICVICLVARFFALPYSDYIKNKSDRIQEKILDNQIARYEFDKIPKMEADFDEFQQGKENLNVILEVEREVDFIKKLESISQETGNKINLKITDEKNISQNSGSSKSASGKNKKSEKDIEDDFEYKNFIQMQIELIGNYAGLVNFVKKVENLSNYVNIISIDLKKETEEEKKIREGKSQSTNVFSIPKTNGDSNAESVSKKEVLDSIINVIVYVK